MTLTATPKGTSSDSFCTVAEANAYHNSRLHNEAWFDASEESKERALKWATIQLDNMLWKGSKTTTAQALTWPRDEVVDTNGDDVDSDTIPKFLINATSEYAFELLKLDREKDSDTKGISQVMAGEVMVKFNNSDRAGATPSSVYRLIRHYVASGGSPNFPNIERA